VWSPRLTVKLGRVLFVMNRYLPFISTIMSINIFIINTKFSTCRTEYLVAASFVFIGYITAIFTLFTRAYAVWPQNQAMLTLLITFYSIALGTSAFVTARYFSGAIALNAELLPTGCAYAFANRIVWVALVISIGCESGVGTVTHESGEAFPLFELEPYGRDDSRWHWIFRVQHRGLYITFYAVVS